MVTQAERVAQYEIFYAGTRQTGGTVYTGPGAPIAGTHILTPTGEKVARGAYTVGPPGQEVSMSTEQYAKYKQEQEAVSRPVTSSDFVRFQAERTGQPTFIQTETGKIDVYIPTTARTAVPTAYPRPEGAPQVTPSFQPEYGQRTLRTQEMIPLGMMISPVDQTYVRQPILSQREQERFSAWERQVEPSRRAGATFLSPYGIQYTSATLFAPERRREVVQKAWKKAQTATPAEWAIGSVFGTVPGYVGTTVLGGQLTKEVGTIAVAKLGAPSHALTRGAKVVLSSLYVGQKGYAVAEAVGRGDKVKLGEIGIRTAIEIPAFTAGYRRGIRLVKQPVRIETGFLSAAEVSAERGREFTVFKTRVGKETYPSFGKTFFVQDAERTYAISSMITLKGEKILPSAVFTKGIELPRTALAQDIGAVPFAEKSLVIKPRTGVRGRIFGGYETEMVAAKGVSRYIDMQTFGTIGTSLSERGEGVFKGVTKIKIGARLEAFPGSSYGLVSPMPPTQTAPQIAGAMPGVVPWPTRPIIPPPMPIVWVSKKGKAVERVSALKIEPFRRFEPVFKQATMQTQRRDMMQVRFQGTEMELKRAYEMRHDMLRLQELSQEESQLFKLGQKTVMAQMPKEKTVVPVVPMMTVPTPMMTPTMPLGAVGTKMRIPSRPTMRMKKKVIKRTYRYTPTVVGAVFRKPLKRAPARVTMGAVGIRAPLQQMRPTYAGGMMMGGIGRIGGRPPKKRTGVWERSISAVGKQMGSTLGIGSGGMPSMGMGSLGLKGKRKRKKKKKARRKKR